MSQHQIESSARGMLKNFGRDAMAAAMRISERYEARGDLNAVETWNAIAEFVLKLRESRGAQLTDIDDVAAASHTSTLF